MWAGHIQIILLLLLVNLFPKVIIITFRSSCCRILKLEKTFVSVIKTGSLTTASSVRVYEFISKLVYFLYV